LQKTETVNPTESQSGTCGILRLVRFGAGL
jgi:hypothetical protein